MVTISSFFKILLLLLFFALQYCIGFAIHQHENMNMCTPVVVSCWCMTISSYLSIFSPQSVRSAQFSQSVVSDSLRPHELQQSRLPCPSPTPGVYPNPCLLCWWCHPTISSYHPLLLLPSIPPSIRVFSNGSTLRMSWPKYWSFSFSISPSKEIPGLIFGMDWLALLAVQGTLKSLLQHHSPKALILQHSALFIV